MKVDGRSKRRKRIVGGRQQCSACKKWIPVELFGPSKVTYHKIETRCRKCNTARTQKKASDSLDAYFNRIVNSHYRLSPRGSDRRLKMMEKSEVSKKLLRDLYAEQVGLCAVTGVPLTHKCGSGYVASNISIDRIDNERGYEEGNMQLVCRVVNTMKLHMDDSTFLHWAKRVANGPMAKRLEQDSQSETNPRQGTYK